MGFYILYYLLFCGAGLIAYLVLALMPMGQPFGLAFLVAGFLLVPFGLHVYHGPPNGDGFAAHMFNPWQFRCALKGFVVATIVQSFRHMVLREKPFGFLYWAMLLLGGVITISPWPVV